MLQRQQRQDATAQRQWLRATEQLALSQYEAFLTGLERYRHASIRRVRPEPPVLWQQGSTRLLDFGSGGAGQQPILLIIPSLINRYYVVDMDEGQSFVAAAAGAGLRPLVVDWALPGAAEQDFGVDDYMKHRLLPLLRFLSQRFGQKIHIMGYCMGGLLAAALAYRLPQYSRSLVFVSTPRAFSAPRPTPHPNHAALLAQVAPLCQASGMFPAEALQGYFTSLNPFGLCDKFVRFAKTEPGSAAERHFVLVEDWLHDGVPLVKKVAETCFGDWYGANKPALGRWQVLGERIRPHLLRLPSLHVIPRHDRLVPPESAIALARAMPQPDLIQPDFGHVSIMVHGAARDEVWPILFAWLVRH